MKDIRERARELADFLPTDSSGPCSCMNTSEAREIADVMRLVAEARVESVVAQNTLSGYGIVCDLPIANRRVLVIVLPEGSK